MRPFDNVTLSQRVRDHLRDEILSNRLSPGTHLQEEVVAEQLGISRAPVREALRLLAAEDLVTITPRRGAIVKSLSPLEFPPRTRCARRWDAGDPGWPCPVHHR
jgi:DNA-binding GntR family transcriptional regulator